MPFEPKNITKDHVMKAINQTKIQKLDLILSTRFDVIINSD